MGYLGYSTSFRQVVYDIVQSMKNVVVIPFNVPWEWSTDYLNQTAFELSKQDNIVICYLWGDVKYLGEIFVSGEYPKLVKRIKKDIYLVNPVYIIPFRRFKLIRQLNSSINILFLRFISELISFFKRCKKKIFWLFDPNLIFIYESFGDKYELLYDCVDYFIAGDKGATALTSRNEKRVCGLSKYVFANSKVLQKHLSKYRKDVCLVPQGFRYQDFKIVGKKGIDFKLKHPVIGFIGGLNNRLDTSLLLPLIKNNPEWNFVLWGPIQKDLSTGNDRLEEIKDILKLPNVTTGVSNNKRKIPGLVSQFDVGIIPYDISQDFNKYCYPMKVFEYFYFGKPVVSTNIIELKRFPGLVRIGGSYQEWQTIIRNVLDYPLSNTQKNKMKKLSISNSWGHKVSLVLSSISNEP